jgi:hypothetical protein
MRDEFAMKNAKNSQMRYVLSRLNARLDSIRVYTFRKMAGHD